MKNKIKNNSYLLFDINILQASAKTVTGSELLVFAVPTPSTGVKVLMGSDLLKSVQAIVLENCMSGANSKCESAVANVLPIAQVELQRKNDPEIKLSAVGIVAVIIGLVRSPNRDDLQGGMWELGIFDKFEGMSARPSSTVVILSEEGDKNPYTIVSSARPKPTVVKEDNGDIAIKLDQAQVDSINDIMSKKQKCQPARKRGLDASCFVSSAEFLMVNTLKGLMADLAMPVENIPHPGGVDPDAHAMLLALYMFILSARKMYLGAFGKVLDANIPMTDIELTVFWIVYIVATGSPLKVENKIKSDHINPHCKPPRYECPDESCKGKLGYCTTGDQIGCTCEEEECPTADRIPSCPNCGADDGSLKCNGLKIPEDMWKGCDCIPNGEHQIYAIDIVKDKADQKKLSSLVKRPSVDKNKECGGKIGMSKKLFGGSLQVDLKWAPRKVASQNCYDTCEGVFNAFFNRQCANEDRDEMAEHGSFKHNCGQASYFIKNIPPPPPPPLKPVAPYSEGKCRVKTKQWNNTYKRPANLANVHPTDGYRSTYSVEVEIFDNNSNKIGWTAKRISAGPANSKESSEDTTL